MQTFRYFVLGIGGISLITVATIIEHYNYPATNICGGFGLVLLIVQAAILFKG